MMLSGRRLLMMASLLVVVAGVAAWAAKVARPELAVPVILIGFAGVIVTSLIRPSEEEPAGEPDDIAAVSDERQQELFRGTSLFLREMKYRYSIRLDASATGDRRCFSAEVNTVRLGFIPAVIIDNTNDRQGYGYVAFVHDGDRWRGPGLPCPADQTDAVKHAARCVSPLAKEEETHFEGTTAH